ncbi:hypothetical protein JCM10207_000500 [Rhodosporidiobolus poonsookiae]
MFARAAARSTIRQATAAPRQAARRYATGHHTSVAPAKVCTPSRLASSGARELTRLFHLLPFLPRCSDLPWIVGSALVFVPLFISLTSPPEALKHATSAHKPEHADKIPASTVATESEPAEDKEPSPKDAEKADEKEDAKEPEQAEKAAPKQEGEKKEDAEDVEKQKEEAKPTGGAAASEQQKKESSPEAKEEAKVAQPAHAEKVEKAVEESKEEADKKDE